MDISPNTLRKETAQVYKEVDDLLNGPTQYEAHIRATLLLTKAQCIHTLTLLNEQGKRK